MTACGKRLTPVTAYGNDYFYIDKSSEKTSDRPLCRYNLLTREKEKLTNSTGLVLWDGNYIYYDSTDESGSVFGWRIGEINVMTNERNDIYVAGSCEHCTYDMRIENGKLQIKDYATERYFDIKQIE